jgi:hypothetical protein
MVGAGSSTPTAASIRRCARAASGQAAAPPRSEMNLRRLRTGGERKWVAISPRRCTGGTSDAGHSRPGRASGRSGHVRCTLIATDLCGTAEFRDVPNPEVANRNGLAKKCSQRVPRRLVVDSFCAAPARFDHVRLSFASQVKAAKIPGSCKS